MDICKIPLWNQEEYCCPTKGVFVPFIAGYLHKEGGHPAMLIVPGGAYSMVAAGEGEIVAKRFYEEGFDAYVLVYTCALFEGHPVGNQPLRDIAKAVYLIRKRNEGKLVVCGFSAGGHLAASIGVHWNDPEIAPIEAEESKMLRPDAEILCYPVITSGEYAHKDSFLALYGPDATEQQLHYASVEKNVTESTPPTFLWHTVTDADVPMENSLCYAAAFKRAKIPFELHLFADGPHGYSLADEKWARGEYGSFYTMEQFFANMQYHIDEQIPLENGQPLPPKGTDFRTMFEQMPKEYLKAEENPAVAVWVTLAVNWLKGENIL